MVFFGGREGGVGGGVCGVLVFEGLICRQDLYPVVTDSLPLQPTGGGGFYAGVSLGRS